MGTINQMGYSIQFRYKQELDSDELSRNLYGVISPAVIEGFNVSKETAGSISISAGTLWVADITLEPMVFWVHATKSVVIPVLNSGRYLCVSYTYLPTVENYPDFIITDTPSAGDVVLAELVWDTSTGGLISVRNSVKTVSLQNELDETIRSFDYSVSKSGSNYQITVNKGSVLFDGKIYTFLGDTLNLPSTITGNLLVYLQLSTTTIGELEVSMSETIPSTTVSVPAGSVALPVNSTYIPVCQFNLDATGQPRAYNLIDRRSRLVGVLGSTASQTTIGFDTTSKFSTIKGTVLSDALVSIDEMVSNTSYKNYVGVSGLTVTRVNSTLIQIGDGIIWYPEPTANGWFKIVRHKFTAKEVSCIENATDVGNYYLVKAFKNSNQEIVVECIDLTSGVQATGSEVFVALILKSDTTKISESVRCFNSLWLQGLGIGVKKITVPTTGNLNFIFTTNSLYNFGYPSQTLEGTITDSGYLYLDMSSGLLPSAWLWKSLTGVNLPDSGFSIKVSFINDLLTFTMIDADYETVSNYIYSMGSPRINIGGFNYFREGIKLETGKIDYPVGMVYQQYPNATTLQFMNIESPSYLFGGVWELQFNDSSYFFRTEGTTAMENRTNGVQGDSVRNVVGSFAVQGTGFHDARTTEVFNSQPQYGTFAVISSSMAYGSHSAIYFSLAGGGIPTGSESRPINILVRIWKKIS